MSAAAPAIVHDAENSQFVMLLQGRQAVCAYRRRGGVVEFTHTEVPAALQGQGLAARLVAHALDWVRAEGLRARPVCSYVVSYMRRHAETQDLLAD